MAVTAVATTYVRAWEVRCDSPSDGPKLAMEHADVPVIGDIYLTTTESDGNAYAQNKSVEVLAWKGDGVDYLVTVNYGPLDSVSFGAEPLEWPIRIRCSFQKYDRALFVDQDGNAIRNSAGDPFGEPILVEDNRPILVVTRNESVNAFSLTLAAQYQDTVNAALWNGFPARTVRCTDIQTGDEQKDPATGLYYYSVSYVFEIKWETWTKEILDQGYAYLDSGTRKPFLDAEKQPISDPQPLDGSGVALDPFDPPVNLTFRILADSDFSAFNIDFSDAIGRF